MVSGATMDIRTVRTYGLLTSTLEQLLECKRLEDISVTEICKLSTVRRGTFYRHFTDKYEFFAYYLRTLADQFMQSAEQRDELSDLSTYARHMHRSLLEFTERHTSLVRNHLGQAMVTETMDMIVNQIAEGIVLRIERYPSYVNGEIAVSAKFIGIFYAGGLLQTLRWWTREGKPISAAELERQSTNFLMNDLMGLGSATTQ
jgi:AcrR family transcriptional regulator